MTLRFVRFRALRPQIINSQKASSHQIREPEDSSSTPRYTSPHPYTMYTMVSPSPSRRIHMRKFSKLSEASILAAPGAQCRLMCSAAAHKIELHHAGLYSPVHNRQSQTPLWQFQPKAHSGLIPSIRPRGRRRQQVEEANHCIVDL